jgi:hypothetical protein
MLQALTLPELVTATPKDYEELAVELATQSAKLADVRRQLANSRSTSSFFDTRGFTRLLEQAFGMMLSGIARARRRLTSSCHDNHSVICRALNLPNYRRITFYSRWTWARSWLMRDAVYLVVRSAVIQRRARRAFVPI